MRQQCWWVTANQETDNHAWHWDNFFNDSLNDKNAVWGCGEITEATSLARIAKMASGDVVVAPQRETSTRLFSKGLLMLRWTSFYGSLAMIALACVGTSLPGCNPPVGNAKDTPIKAATAKITRQFQVEGMHCDGCAQSITAALQAVPGIKSATVSFESKKATVVTEGKQLATSEIEKTINDLGFKARLLAPSNEPPATSKVLRTGEPAGAAK